MTSGQNAAAERVSAWVKSLGQSAGADTTLRFAPSTSNSIDITHANPSGLAQFLAGRRTRLSTLLHDADQFATAKRTARALSAKTTELWDERGIDVGYLAAGVANWRAVHEGKSEPVSAPIMLGRITLSKHLDHDDYDVQLVGRAEISPAFVRQFEADHHTKVDVEAVDAAAYSIARFDPVRGMDALRQQVSEVPGVVVGHRLLVSTFSDLIDPADPAILTGAHPVIEALIRAEERASDPAPAAPAAAEKAQPEAPAETETETSPEPSADTQPEAKSEESAGSRLRRVASLIKDSSKPRRTPPAAAPTITSTRKVHTGTSVLAKNSDERDPADELYLLDADESQARMLDYIAAGESVSINAASGTGATQTALNAAGLLAAQGKRVLVVAEQRSAAEEFVRRFNEQLDAGSLLLEPNEDPDALRNLLIRAILRNERATEPQLGGLLKKLRESRGALHEHVKSLHSVRSRWGCSPYQAMQELARLTSLDPAPSTTVRLKRSVLDSMGQRGHVAAQLKRAAQLGAFSKSHTTSPWFGAPLRNQEATEQALNLAGGLGRDLPILHEHMLKIAAQSQIRLEDSYDKWGDQLQLLVAVRGSLDKFEADIFEGDIDDLIAATASSAWRREHGVEMGSIVRSRLRKIAKEYVRPGMHVADLQAALQAVSIQRDAWRAIATSQRNPAVPGGLLDVEAGYHDAGARIDKLSQMLPPQVGTGLREMPIAELLDIIAALVDRKEDLAELPERTLIAEQLAEGGLADLLADFADREIDADAVDAELELAWWQSALEAMISGDDFLAMNDGAKLEKIEADYRLADGAHISSGPSRIRWELARNWKAALADHRAASRQLRATLKDGTLTVAGLLEFGPALVGSLTPVFVSAPLLLGSALPADTEFDAVILLEANYLTLREVLDAIRRSKQVIAIGDQMLGGPKPFEVSVDPTARLKERNPGRSALSALNEVLVTGTLSTVYRGIDEGLVEQLSRTYYDSAISRLPVAVTITGSSPLLTGVYVPDATGTLSNSEDGVQTTAAEVAKVVDLVFAHFASRGTESLAVIASNRAHAAAIAEAIRVQLPNHKYAMDFLRSKVEPFVVTTMDRLIGVRRDAVIFAWGYGRTPHGKTLHEFGALSREGGEQLFVSAMTRSRKRMTLVSSLLPADVDLDRVYRGAWQFFELFGRVEAGDSGVSTVGSPRFDALVSDLARRLRERGAIVAEDYRGVLDLSAHALDMDGDSPVRPLAVVYDGTEHYAGLTVRERSRLRPEFFENHGWRYVPLWTIDVFTDPASVTDRLARSLELAPAASAHPRTGPRTRVPMAPPVSASSVTAQPDSAKPAVKPADKAGKADKAEAKSVQEAESAQQPATPAPIPASADAAGTAPAADQQTQKPQGK
ncbi:DNA helicase [Glutamicibacter sp.]|uniref:DNA helicase n=1 Tax=Glutamicibacter sp. TaxID=1931995 RepID=UPI002B463121|nr:DNA helicase [Glutamicibacter sp.]HJX77819.1 DNA helicase [Glutamicibacter sp.]